MVIPKTKTSPAKYQVKFNDRVRTEKILLEPVRHIKSYGKQSLRTDSMTLLTYIKEKTLAVSWFFGLLAEVFADLSKQTCSQGRLIFGNLDSCKTRLFEKCSNLASFYRNPNIKLGCLRTSHGYQYPCRGSISLFEFQG